MKQEQVLEKIDKALVDLESSLAQGESESLKNYLKFMGSFHEYSFGNIILIYSQFPAASYVAGFRRWKTLGRFVKKGEKSIRILAPLVKKKQDADLTEDETKSAIFGFRSVGVFDVSQTEGKELPSIGKYVGDASGQLVALEEFVAAKEIELCYKIPEGGALGVSKGGVIEVDPRLETAEKFATLVHEVAHELLHKSDRRSETTKSLRETEAEAVAYSVCSAIGIESNGHASNYIQLHQGDVQKLKASLDLIRAAAAEIFSALTVSNHETSKAVLVGRA